MASFNKVILIGNLTANPELKQTQSGLSVCSFSLAVNRRSGKEGQQTVDFINVTAWRQTAEFVCKYFVKGRPMLVCGSLQTRSWEAADGSKRTATEVVADEVTFVDSRRDDGGTAPAAAAPAENYVPDAYRQQSFEAYQPTADDALPF